MISLLNIIVLLIVVLVLLKCNDCYYNKITSLSMLKEKISSSSKSLGSGVGLISPVKKIAKQPILTINDKNTGAKITLIGVSHGSKGSASLVKNVINDINPAVVVLELCEDRYLSISISNNIEVPRENMTIYNKYNEYLDKVKLSDSNQKSNNAIQRIMSDMIKIGIYVKSQGVIGGFFLIVGLFFSSFQRINQTADEFATAMIEAGERGIPLRMGDAAQNDTMNSMKKILDIDTFNPERIYKDSLMFLFSMLGVFPKLSGDPNINSKIPDATLKSSEWLNIPQAYGDDISMIKSLWPLIFLNLLSAGLDYYNTIENTSKVLPPTTFPSADNNIFDTISTLLQMEVPPYIAEPLSYLVNLLGVLIVIRIAKLIGSDRDVIIASKIQEVAKEFPNKEIVCVIGMLHANGVSRILMSGEDPLRVSNPKL